MTWSLPGLAPDEVRSQADLAAWLAANPDCGPDAVVKATVAASAKCHICGDIGLLTETGQNPDGTVTVSIEPGQFVLIDDAAEYLRQHWDAVHEGTCLVVDTGTRGLMVKAERRDV